jgi:acetyl-CoA synthetase
MGVPLPGWLPSVLRTDADRSAELGELGRLAVDMVSSPVAWFDGYVNSPEATRDKFSADGRWYFTGDCGRLDESGHYFFTARDDDVIIMAGYRIGPFDVESILATHPHVQESAVIAVPDQLMGEVIEAFVVLKSAHDDPDHVAEELRQLVRDNLAAYAYPRAVHFVDELPKTPSGKVQRYLLRARRQQAAARD